MNLRNALTAFTLTAFAFGLAVAQEAPPTPAKGLGSLEWLAGDWEGDGLRVHYTSPAGGKLLGVTKLVQGEDCPFFEFEVFEQRGAEVVVQPYPGGQPAASFRLTALEPQRAVFENPKNAFPQRIEYSRKGDTLTFTLSAERKGERKVERYAVRRR